MNRIKTTLVLGALTGVLVALGFFAGGQKGAILGLVIAIVMNFGAYWFSDKIVLAQYRAKAVTPEESPRMHAIVDRLCARSGMPKPRVYVLPEASPNAFATGRNPAHAAIAATEGLLQLMTDDELEGVLAHELAHVKNRDILISSIAATLAGAVAIVASMVKWGAILGSGRSDSRGGGSNPIAALVAAITLPFVALLLQMIVSRSREYGADVTGSEMTGNPEALANALAKLGHASGRIPMNASPSTSHLFIVKPNLGWATKFLSTHPPLEDRIARLRSMRV